LLQRRVFSERRLGLVLAAACLAVLVLAVGRPTSADAGASGQKEAWTVHFGTDPGELYDPSDFGVDPVDGSTYTLSEAVDGSGVRIDKFSPDGTFVASASVPRGFNEPEEEQPNGFIGIAVDHQAKRLYLVESEYDESTEVPVAVRLLIFSTEPEGSALKPTGAESVALTGSTAGEALFSPNEIHVDPQTHELILSAVDPTGKVIFQGFTSEGVRTGRYTESGTLLRPSKPGTQLLNFAFDIAADGTTYVVANSGLDEEGHAAIKGFSLPSGFDSLPAAPSTLEEIPGFVAAAEAEDWPDTNPFALRLVAPNFRGKGNGPQLAVTTAPDGEETLYWKAYSSSAEHGGVQIHGYSLRQHATTALYGGGSAEGECAIETGSAALAGTTGGELMVLDQGEFVEGTNQSPGFGLQVLRFGQGGEFCPGPAAAIELKSGSTAVSSVAAGTNVTLDASKSELAGLTPSELVWTITKSGGTPQVIPVTGAPASMTLAHVFAEEGDYKVQLGIKLSTIVGSVGNHFVAKPVALTVTAGGGGAGPTVSSVAPDHGPIAGGNLVKVVGAELAGATKVEFGTTAVSCPSTTAGTICTLKSPTEIEVDAPAHAAGSVDVKVTTAAGTSPTGAGDQYIYEGAGPSGPTVSAVTPNHGPIAGGSLVKVFGAELSGATKVEFGTTAVSCPSTTAGTICTLKSPTEIEVDAPAHAAGSVDVKVTTAAGTSPIGTGDAYTYDAPIVTHTLTISKSGTGSGSVTCNGTSCATSYAAGTSITLAATASSGSSFAGWNGGGCSGTGGCTVVINADTAVTAIFNLASSGGGGGGNGGGGGGSNSNTGTNTPGGGGNTVPTTKTPAQKLAEKRQKAIAQCKKKNGKAKAQCLKKAHQIGKPKKKSKAHKK
jgi:hypothetical protein